MAQKTQAPSLVDLYAQGPLYGLPGVQSLIWESAFNIPLAASSGIRCGPCLRVLQEPLVFLPQAVPQAGLGGFNAGQFMLTPLSSSGDDTTSL